MANEFLIDHETGVTLYVLLFDATGQVYNGATFVAPSSASWTDYDIAMSEVATATGIYRASMPAVAADAYGWVVRQQVGASPAPSDIRVGVGSIRWTGTTEETVPASANVTRVMDTALTETGAGRLAASFSKFGDVATPAATAASVDQTGDSFARLGAPVGASISADVADVEGKVDDLETRLTAARAGYLDNINNAALQTTVAQTGDAFARLGAPVLASISADVAGVKSDLASTNTTVDDIFDDVGDVRTVVDAILLDTSTDGVKIAPAQGAVAFSGQVKITADLANQGALHIVNVNADGRGLHNQGGYIGQFNDGDIALFNSGDSYGARNEGVIPIAPESITGTGVRSAVGLAAANLDTQLAAITADTSELQTDWHDGGRLDLILDAAAAAAAAGLDAAGVRAAVGLALANLDTQLSDIQSTVDQLDDIFIYTLTTDGTTPIRDALVQAFSDAAMTVIVDYGITDYYGKVRLHLKEPGTYYLHRTKVGASFVNPDIETIP